jgi:hypothetical protein
MHHSHKVLYLRSANPHRPPPSLNVYIGLEARPVVRVIAANDADTARLVSWLATSGAVAQLPEIVTEAVDRLRPGGEESAA